MFHWQTNMQKREITVLYRRLQYGEWFEILYGKEESFAGNFIKSSGSNVLLNRGKAKTIKEAIDAVGISRSSYYKYKDDIFPIHEKIQGKTITFVMEMEDQPGLLSSILKIVADCKANILSIHQSIPVNHIALITLSVMILPITEDVAVLFDRIENADGINNLKIVSEE